MSELRTAAEKVQARMVRSMIALTPEQNAALRTLSAQTGVPVAAYVREAISSWLRENGAQWRAK